VDGGISEQPESARPQAFMVTRAAADVATIESDPYLGAALSHLHEAITEVAQTRWPARGPEVVAAAVRVLAREQARLDAAQLTVLHQVETRDDVVPRARPGSSRAAAFLCGTGTDHRRAIRDADAARLVVGLDAELSQVGAAYAAGDIRRGHLDVAVSVHGRLHAAVRNALMRVADPATGEATDRPCIEVVDQALAREARRFSVPEFARIADRIVEDLDPPDPKDAHSRRYLYLSKLADGSVRGRFACGPAQALTLTAVLAALAGPQPGKAVDADGVERDLPDERSAPQRRMDALVDAIDHNHPECHCRHAAESTRNAEPAPEAACSTDSANDGGADDLAASAQDETGVDNSAGHGCAGSDIDSGIEDPAFLGSDLVPFSEPPPTEGELQIRRPPGMRAGPYPEIQIIVTATLEQLAHARRHARGSPLRQDGLDLDASDAGSDGFAHAQHAGRIHPSVLGLLACSGRVRRAVLDEHGAVLQLGRSHRLATPVQKAALFARDVGCVIPGCTVSGDLCEIHHVVPWVDGGVTEIGNLVFVCPRHHIDVTDGTWQLQMIDGVPWARPPAWVHPGRPLLRNACHRPPAAAV
jgi:hypothetical protein